MPGFVAVNIAKGAVELFQRDFDTALNVGNVVTAQNNQRTVARSAFGIARQLNADHFGIGGFHRFVRRHNVRACAGAGAENADGAIALFKLHRVQQGGIDIGDNQTQGVANGGPDKFR